MTALFTRHCVACNLVSGVTKTLKYFLSLGHSARLDLIGVPGIVLVTVELIEGGAFLDGQRVDAHVAHAKGRKLA